MEERKQVPEGARSGWGSTQGSLGLGNGGCLSGPAGAEGTKAGLGQDRQSGFSEWPLRGAGGSHAKARGSNPDPSMPGTAALPASPWQAGGGLLTEEPGPGHHLQAGAVHSPEGSLGWREKTSRHAMEVCVFIWNNGRKRTRVSATRRPPWISLAAQKLCCVCQDSRGTVQQEGPVVTMEAQDSHPWQLI